MKESRTFRGNPTFTFSDCGAYFAFLLDVMLLIHDAFTAVLARLSTFESNHGLWVRSVRSTAASNAKTVWLQRSLVTLRRNVWFGPTTGNTVSFFVLVLRKNLVSIAHTPGDFLKRRALEGDFGSRHVGIFTFYSKPPSVHALMGCFASLLQNVTIKKGKMHLRTKAGRKVLCRKQVNEGRGLLRPQWEINRKQQDRCERRTL